MMMEAEADSTNIINGGTFSNITQEFPCIYTERHTATYSNDYLWDVKINLKHNYIHRENELKTTSTDDKDIIHLEVRFHYEHHISPATVELIKSERRLNTYLPIWHILQCKWQCRVSLPRFFKELHSLLSYPLPIRPIVSTCLARHRIPVELRVVIESFCRGPAYRLDNSNIQYAVWLWIHRRDLALLRYGHISSWDTSLVTNMDFLFSQAESFNDNLNDWDVSHVVSMKRMFFRAKAFNQPLNRWDVRGVTNMQEMFMLAEDFNQPLDQWDVSNIVSMKAMFTGAKAFNQPLDRWNIEKVRDMSYMFRYATSFDPSLLVSSWEAAQRANDTNLENMLDDSRFIIDHCSNAEDNKEFQIVLRGLVKNIWLKVKPLELIINVKETLQSKDGVSVDTVEFIFRYKLLEDCMTVTECGLTEDYGVYYNTRQKKESTESIEYGRGFEKLFTYEYGKELVLY